MNRVLIFAVVMALAMPVAAATVPAASWDGVVPVYVGDVQEARLTVAGVTTNGTGPWLVAHAQDGIHTWSLAIQDHGGQWTNTTGGVYVHDIATPVATVQDDVQVLADDTTKILGEFQNLDFLTSAQVKAILANGVEKDLDTLLDNADANTQIVKDQEHRVEILSGTWGANAIAYVLVAIGFLAVLIRIHRVQRLMVIKDHALVILADMAGLDLRSLGRQEPRSPEAAAAAAEVTDEA